MPNQYCKFGCKQIAVYQNKQGHWQCAKHHTQCPVNRGKNAKAIFEAHALGKLNVNHLNTEIRGKGRRGKHFIDFGIGDINKPALKVMLIEERGHACENCKLSEWLGKPITLELEHIDGLKINNTRDNLKLLCPNCHSYTPTWRRKKSALVTQLA